MIFDKKKIPLYKKIISYFHPVWLAHEKGKVTPYLDILYYRNRFQLATTDALYSDGDRYTPAIAVVNNIPDLLPRLKHVLVLGSGLGSMVQVIRARNVNPAITLVDIDPVILNMAVAALAPLPDLKMTPVCADAAKFITTNADKYDLIFIDIFEGRRVPDFVRSYEFLAACRQLLNDGGRVAFNYIIPNDEDWHVTQQTFASVFPAYTIISNEINRIFIGG